MLMLPLDWSISRPPSPEIGGCDYLSAVPLLSLTLWLPPGHLSAHFGAERPPPPYAEAVARILPHRSAIERLIAPSMQPLPL